MSVSIHDDHVYDQNDHNDGNVQWGESSHDETNTQDDTTNLTQQDSHDDETEGQNLTRNTRTKS